MNVDESIEIAAPRAHVLDLPADPDLIPTWWPIIRRFEPRPRGRFELDERELHTLVRLSHGTFEHAEQATVHAGMWRHHLGRLKDAAESTRQGAHG